MGSDARKEVTATISCTGPVPTNAAKGCEHLTANHDRESKIENRRLCLECFGDAFLHAEIKKDGIKGVCSYCGEAGRTFSIGEMADIVEQALKRHFYRTPAEPRAWNTR
jgi:hypothetical protein